ncbi:AraC family transcriptional regulator [Hymenobacter sp. BT683]|uniref:AraC family transcriptional regulator n=1 Tax=Hymenobacter jeongseonensis TaxID=2791027 RepID=A0ABS0IN12_9BACT|nr:helix-turn-helix domain-containing protein [Hymenobacter jeongseonensis]MBF9239748.1 AraC family transcriptional regulator [Hymenobacter jeongseonensis]
MATPLLPSPRPDIYPSVSPSGGEITVLTMQEAECGLGHYDRRDVFKCVLVLRGANELHYATRSYLIDRPALVFTNRLVPFSWEPVEGTGEQEGYICAFTEPFLQSAMRGVRLKESVLYRVDGNPVYYLDDEQQRYLGEVFGRMRKDFDTEYEHKDELLRSQLSLIVHEATRLEPASSFPAVATNSAERVTNLFMTLLDIQFPVTKAYNEPLLKNAQEYADRLAVHVNSLNRAVKQVTGKPTTAHIADRITSEAKVLLHHTDWSVGDIADRLGFEYATYFHRFFKQHTGTTPLAFRQAA